MYSIQREGNIITVGTRVRIEPGPRLVKATASKELLHNDVTAKHYQEGALDAYGQTIELGQPMTYLDWNGHRDPEVDGATSWYVYLYEELTAAELEAREVTPEALALLSSEDREAATHIWREKAAEESEDVAFARAFSLLEGQS